VLDNSSPEGGCTADSQNIVFIKSAWHNGQSPTWCCYNSRSIIFSFSFKQHGGSTVRPQKQQEMKGVGTQTWNSLHISSARYHDLTSLPTSRSEPDYEYTTLAVRAILCGNETWTVKEQHIQNHSSRCDFLLEKPQNTHCLTTKGIKTSRKHNKIQPVLEKAIITNTNGYNVFAGWADLDSHKLLWNTNRQEGGS
jgi:hypothetical protein